MVESSTTQLVKQLEEISADIPKRGTDYRGKIDAWNKYWDTLNRIDGILRLGQGEQLRRNFKTNFKQYPERSGGDLAPFGWSDRLFAYLLFGIGASVVLGLISLLAFNPYTTTVFAVLAGLQIRYHAPRLIPPRTLKFSMKPKIHIDEMASVRSQIKGIPSEVQKDPTIALPKISIAIPRSWFGQEAIHDVMNRMEDVRLQDTTSAFTATQSIPFYLSTSSGSF